MSFVNTIIKKLSPPWGSAQTPVSSGWTVREAAPGNWQRNIELSTDSLLNHPAVFACTSLISSTIGKLAVNLVKEQDGVWTKVDNHPAYGGVLRKPNRWSTRQQFYTQWALSVLIHGNAYSLVRRDKRNVIVEFFLLNPERVKPLISESGEVFYELQVDDLATVHKAITVPASEIIHDRWYAPGHPLVGVSPLVAAALPVLQSKTLMDNSVAFAANASRVGGVLTAPGAVSDESVEQIRKYWSENFSKGNSGRVAVLADGLSWTSFDQTSNGDSQLVEQLGFSAETVCSVFGVPPHLIGVGDKQSNSNLITLNQQFYSVCIQSKLESIEALLGEALRLPANLGIEFDLDGLLRLDPAALVATTRDAVLGGVMTVNEGRLRLGLPPTQEGGDSVYLQQQWFSLAALAKRDAQDNPFSNDNSNDASKMIDLLDNIKGLAA